MTDTSKPTARPSKRSAAARRSAAKDGSGATRAAEAAAIRRGSGRHLDDPLFVPRLDLLELPTERTASGTGLGYSEILETICGVADDSQPVEQYDGTLGVTRTFVDVHQPAAVQVQWNDDLAAHFTDPGNVNGVRWGSATMISPDLMLTCGHLFDRDPNGWRVPRRNGTAISPQEIATHMHVNFNHQVDPTGVLRAEDRFPITQLVEFRLGGLDMAICRVGGNPGDTYGWAGVSTTNAADGDVLAIIGHPAGAPKRIEAGPATSIVGSVISYDDIDTLGGNSGSGILQASTGRLVGVHTNGGCNVDGTGSNTGVAIAAIRAVSPTLQGLPAGGHTIHLSDSVHTFLAADAGTLHLADTHRAADLLHTKLSTDVLSTFRMADTHSARDVLGTHLAADVGTFASGDVGTFAAGDDPNGTWREGIIDPGSFLIDPPYLAVAGRALAGLRPFVQAGPYQPVGQELVSGDGASSDEGPTAVEVIAQAVMVARAALEHVAALCDALQQAGEPAAEMAPVP